MKRFLQALVVMFLATTFSDATWAGPRPKPHKVVINASAFNHHTRLLVERIKQIRRAVGARRFGQPQRKAATEALAEMETLLQKMRQMMRDAPPASLPEAGATGQEPPAPDVPPSPPVAEAPPVERAQRPAMSAEAFDDFIRSLSTQTTADVKLRQLKLALKGNWLTCDQATRVLGQFTHGSDKLSALRHANPRLTDRANVYRILEAFTHSSDKNSAADILENR